MRLVFSVLIFIAACLIPALASDPGEPLDCGDWVFLEPGLYCVQLEGPPCTSALCDRDLDGGEEYDDTGAHRAVDNEGAVYRVRRVWTGQDCYHSGWNINRLELVRLAASEETVVGYVQDRCIITGGSNVRMDLVMPSRNYNWPGDWAQCQGVLMFDPMKGRMLIPTETRCVPSGSTCHQYPSGRSLLAIQGFTTTFEVLQSYEPTPGALSFRVPYMPEGFPAASHFDSYYGDLATLGDWSKAQPLQCGYPATPPNVGDYFAVNDPLPDPPVNSGRYYVTAVNHMGQTRYGRKSRGGVLSGRDPALLAGCGE